MWGKTCNDLQSNIAITDEVASGTLKYIADYTSAGFDMSAGNHFISLTFKPTSTDSTVTCAFNGSTKTLDGDMTIVLQMTEAKKALSAVFTETLDGEEVGTCTVEMSGLTLASE